MNGELLRLEDTFPGLHGGGWKGSITRTNLKGTETGKEMKHWSSMNSTQGQVKHDKTHDKTQSRTVSFVTGVGIDLENTKRIPEEIRRNNRRRRHRKNDRESFFWIGDYERGLEVTWQLTKETRSPQEGSSTQLESLREPLEDTKTQPAVLPQKSPATEEERTTTTASAKTESLSEC